MTLEQLPSMVESERYVLGSMMKDPEAVPAVTRVLGLDDFYEPRHQKVYETILELLVQREQFDPYTVGHALQEHGTLEEVGGPSYLMELCEVAYAPSNADYHAQAVRDASVRRNIISTAQNMLRNANDTTSPVRDVLDEAESLVFNLGQRGQQGGFKRIAELLDDVNTEIDEALERESHLRGLDTGYADLNNLLSGLQKGDLIILAARPSVGKTAFALNLARNVALEAGESVAFFSLEMSSVQLAFRLLCQQAQVNISRVTQGTANQDEQQALWDAIGQLSSAPIFIDDQSPLTATEMMSRCRRLATELNNEGKKLGLVAVDYLQLMRATTARDQRRLEVAEFSRGLKRLARQIEVPVLACCQLSRSAEKEGKSRRPQLGDLYESDAIGQDADVVMFLHRPDVEAAGDEEQPQPVQLDDNPMIEVVIGKHRNGPTGIVNLMFRKNVGRFDMVAPDFSQEMDGWGGLPNPPDEDNPFL